MGERHTAASRIIFSAKVLGLRAKRWALDFRDRPKRWPRSNAALSGERLELRSALFVDGRAEERNYELGKVENLRVAIESLDGVEIPAGGIFSFWRQLGRATSRRGFVRGRMLQAGCVVPAIGGGLCQLSNSLYELALRTECEIVERHAHSHRLPGSPLRDATVAWNYIDLRFRPRFKTRIELRLTESELIAGFLCEGLVSRQSNSASPALKVYEESARGAPALLETCATCAEIGCSRHESPVGIRRS